MSVADKQALTGGNGNEGSSLGIMYIEGDDKQGVFGGDAGDKQAASGSSDNNNPSLGIMSAKGGSAAPTVKPAYN